MILVSGATGNVGREVVRALVDRKEPVRAPARRDGGPIEGAERVVGDLDHPESLRPRSRVSGGATAAIASYASASFG